jgi:DNA-binding beta-propeller fold protein YncE
MRIPHRLLVGLVMSACTASAPPSAGISARVTRRLTFPDGSNAMRGEAGPTALVVARGKLWALLQNLDRYAPAGPSFLAQVDPSTLALEAMHPLTLGPSECRNATSLLALEETLLVACAGSVALPPSVTRDGALAEVGYDGAVKRLVTVGRSPGGLARVGNDVWMGDGEGGGLSHVGLDTFAVLAGANGDGLVAPCEQGPAKAGFVADAAVLHDRLFVSCFNDDTVRELDPRTGAPLGPPLTTGAGPLKLAPVGDRLYVLDDLGGTLSIVHPGTPARIDRAVLFLGRDGEEGGNDPQGLAGDPRRIAVTNSAYGTLVFVDLAPAPKLVASVDLKTSPDAPSPFPTSVAFDGEAWFVAVPGLEFDARKVASEIVRVEVAE